MAGTLFVHDIELPKAKIQLARTIKLANEQPSSTFLNLPFAEAIDHFLGRRILTRDEFDQLSDKLRFQSFTIANIYAMRTIERIKRQLDRSMQGPEGGGLRGFISQFLDAFGPTDDEGEVQKRRRHLENVYRTTTAGSYNAGRYQMQTDDAVVEAGGVWEYRTALDNRVRESHQALDGKQWEIGDPNGQAVYPPNGFQCRCVMVVVDSEDRDQTQLQRQVNIDEAITDGFRGAPNED